MVKKYPDELYKCNTAKIILMFFVVLGHCCAPFASKTWLPMSGMPFSNVISLVSRFLNSFHIYAFVLVSGYIYRYQKVECEKYKDYIGFLKNKFLRLVVPYVFATIFWALPFRVLIFGSDTNELVCKFLLADSPEQLWFLLMLFWVFMIYDVLSRYAEKKYHFVSIIILICYGVGAVWDFTLDYFQFFKALRFLVFFHIGYGLRKNQELFKRIKDVPYLVFIVATVILFTSDVYFGGVPKNTMLLKILSLGMRFVLNITASLSFFMCIEKTSFASTQNKISAFFLDNTMTIYLFHQQLVYLFVLAIGKFTHSAIIVIPVSFLCTIVTACIISSGVQKWPLTRVLFGVSMKRKSNRANV